MRTGDQMTSLNGLRAWFTVRGTGPICLFPTPGWGASSDLYFETMQPIERLFTVVYLDTRGSGRSARGLPDEAYRLERFTSDLEELRLLLGESKVWVMGHSLGGLLAQEFAVRHPESCRGLVLLSSSAAIDENNLSDMRSRMRQRSGEPWYAEASAMMDREDEIKSDGEFKDYLDKILPFYFHDVSKLDPTVFSHLTCAIEAYKTMTLNASELDHGALDRLPQLDLPAVIVVGDDDFICSPVQALRIHLRLPGSKLVVIPKAGHFPWLEQPEAFYSGLENALRHVGAMTTELAV